MAKRTKYVHTDNDAIAHLWVGHNLSGQGQDNARRPVTNERNGNGTVCSFYFERDTIYSYGSHWPIATFVRSGKKQAIQFTSKDSPSVTTSQHHRIVRSAISGNNIPVFEVRNPKDRDNHAGFNVTDYLDRINDAITAQEKSRATYRIEHNRDVAGALIAECKAYCTFWKIKYPKFPKVPALPADFKARRVREKEREAVRDEARREQREELNAQWEKDNADRIAVHNADVDAFEAHRDQHIAQWLAGGPLGAPEELGRYGYYGDQSHNTIRNIKPLPTLLRIVGDEVETSRHASFPITHAKRGLALVEACMSRGEDWASNGRTCKLGLYAISRIEVTTPEAKAAGGAIIFAGCHVVPYSSVLLIRPEIVADHAPAMEIMHCDDCNEALEEGRIGRCDDCTLAEEEIVKEERIAQLRMRSRMPRKH